jgi:hypothetical protein
VQWANRLQADADGMHKRPACVFALVIVLGLTAMAVITTPIAAVVIGLSGRGGLHGRGRTRSRAGEADSLQIF